MMYPVDAGSHATLAKDHAQAALRLNGQNRGGPLLSQLRQQRRTWTHLEALLTLQVRARAGD
jgi:hypothetical protein